MTCNSRHYGMSWPGGEPVHDATCELPLGHESDHVQHLDEVSIQEWPYKKEEVMERQQIFRDRRNRA